MAVAYPGAGPVARSQNLEHLVGLATRWIESHLDDRPVWESVREYLTALGGYSKSMIDTAVTEAVLDLEWTGAIVYDQYQLRRPGQVGDPAPAPLDEVAKAVLGLGWPSPATGKPYRTIHQTFLELRGRYRHCDVYWAMHERLKGRRLVCAWTRWSRMGDEAILADPTLEPGERAEIEKAVEADLCARYVASLDHPVHLERQFGTRFADIYDPQRRLIIEAKAWTDDVVVLGAITQALLYQTLANWDRHVVDSVAVLLPAEPTDVARLVARNFELTADVIYPDGDSFIQEPLR